MAQEMDRPWGGPDLVPTKVRVYPMVSGPEEVDRPGGGPDLAPTTVRVYAMASGPGNEPAGRRSRSSSHHSESPHNGELSRKWTAPEGGPDLAPTTVRVNVMGSGPGKRPAAGRSGSNSHDNEDLCNGEWFWK